MGNRRDTPPPYPVLPAGEPTVSEFDRQRELIAHQLREFGAGLKDLNRILTDIRVENAARDSRNAVNEKTITEVQKQIAQWQRDTDAALAELEKLLNVKIAELSETFLRRQEMSDAQATQKTKAVEEKMAPLLTTSTKGEVVLKIAAYIGAWIVGILTTALGHYLWKGN